MSNTTGKNVSIVRKIQIILLIIACGALLLFGIPEAATATGERARTAAANQVTLSITDKTNDTMGLDYTICKFKFSIKNNSNTYVSNLSGTMRIFNMYGTELCSGKVSFSGAFEAGSEHAYTVSWKMPTDEKSAEVWNGCFQSLSISFKITSVSLNGGSSIDTDIAEIIKPVDFLYLENTYNTAMNYVNLKQYDSALALFEQISNYKDSSQWVTYCLANREG